jgi:hypothetical protein
MQQQSSEHERDGSSGSSGSGGSEREQGGGEGGEEEGATEPSSSGEEEGEEEQAAEEEGRPAAAAAPAARRQQVGRGRGGRRRRHAFLGLWLERNLPALFPGGGVSVRCELRSDAAGPHTRVDAALYLTNLPACKRYVVLELDDDQHRRRGLIDDLFRINWFVNARFGGGKVYVVRLNPDPYELADGELVAGPPLPERLARLARVLRHIHSALTTTDATYVRVIYLYYSPARLAGLLHRAGCTLSTIEADVEYSLAYRCHADPGYLAGVQRLSQQQQRRGPRGDGGR